jgi:outer membrane receptor protein involved in Fe transport
VTLLALLAASSGMAQETAPAPSAAGAATEEDADIVVLSPFVVDASKDQGYYAENTLAGSRLNAKISDLAPSISVITKQLMDDTASNDINDIFRYEINTEGSLTYTPATQSLRSDGVVDVNAGVAIGGSNVQTNATANRVRGLGTPTMSINYYPSVSAVPMDGYNVSSVEINRGPNSMLFGMGSPAGIVNQSTQSALVSQNKNHVGFRFDSNGSARGELSFNRVLIKDKLAIYGAAVDDEKRFQRKPSYDNTKRLYGAITFKPFSGTTIKANIESYKNDNRRPNSLTPRDYVTQWKDAGSPIWDSVNRTVTNADGDVLGVYVISSSSPYANDVRSFIESMDGYNASLWNAARTTYNGVSIFGTAAATNTASALYVPGLTWTNQARSTMQIVDGELVGWFQPLGGTTYLSSWGTAADPTKNDTTNNTIPTSSQYSSTILWPSLANSAAYNKLWSSSSGWTATASDTIVASSVYKYSGVSDKSIYDWENININQMNFGHDEQMTYNVDFEQRILSNLFFNAGWFRQNYKSVSNYTVAQLNVATLYVDTNKYLSDGSLNPYCGKVYVEDSDPDQWTSKIDTNSYRATLAYTPDFTKHKGWSKWLGRHQLMGMWSRDETMTTSIRKRLEYVASTSTDGTLRYMNNSNDNADGTPSGWNFQSTSLRRQFYLAGADDADATVTQSSGEWNYDTYSGDITVYDYATGTYKTVNMTTTYNVFDASTGRNQRILDSLTAGITSYLWSDRLVTMFGTRRDENRTRSTSNGEIKYADGTVKYAAMTNAEKWVDGYYQYETVFDRWTEWSRLNGTTKTMGGVFKPFLGWNSIERKANSGSLLWQFVRDFGFSYNKSDNFNAPSSNYIDAFGNALPKPTGNGEDYGIQFSLFDNRFFTRVVWFNNTNENELTSPGTSISRLTGNVDTTLFRTWCRTIALINMGFDPTASSFGTGLSTAQEEQVKAAAAEIWGQSYTYYDDLGGTIYATRTAEAKGVELQLNFNPTPGWTMRLTAGKQTTVYSNVLREFDAWYAVRSQVWDNAKASDYLLPQYQQYATAFTTATGKEVNLSTFWTSYGYESNVALTSTYGYYNSALYYAGVVQPQILLSRDLEGQQSPGQRRYRWSYMSNYVFQTGALKGFGFGGSERWEDKAVIGYLGKASGANGTLLDVSDTTKPVYDKANWYTDLWVSYTRRIFKDKVTMKVQLNVDNLFEDGGLRVVAVNLDGSPYSYRIVDSRLFKLTTTFDF